MLKQYKIEIKWAIINSIFLMLWTATERIAGLHDKYIGEEQSFQLFLLIPAVLIYILALLDKRKNFYHGPLSYIKGFFSGLLLTFFILVLTPLVQYINYFIISPHFFSNLIDLTVNSGDYTRVQAEQQINYGKYLFISEIFQMLTGAAFSALVPLFLMTTKPDDLTA